MQLSITVIIIIITVLVSIGGFSNRKIINDLIFYPPAITRDKQWYRFFSCGLIHADYGHLIFNMLTLFFFGPIVEENFKGIFGEVGKWYYLGLYVLALLVSLLPTYIKNKDNYYYRSLGASGAVSAVVFVFLMLEPYREIGLFILPPIIPGFIFGPLYLIISAWMDRKGGDNINHSAHFWGALFGVLFIIIVGRTADYDAIQGFLNGIQIYLRSKGWA